MEENKKGMTHPQWVSDAAEWQEADGENRSILIFAIEGVDGSSVIGGNSIALINTLVNAIMRDPNMKACIEGAMKVIDNPKHAMAFGSALSDFIKEHGYDKN